MKRTPLHELFNQRVPQDSIDEQLKIFDFLIEKYADVNAKDMDGFTALHFGCQFNNVHAVEHLLSNDEIKLNVIFLFLMKKI